MDSEPSNHRDPEISAAPDIGRAASADPLFAGTPARRSLRAHFVTGVIVAAPVVITIYLVSLFIGWVDGFVERMIPVRYLPQTYLPFAIPGLGVVIAAVALTLIGALAANFMGRWLVRTGDHVVDRMPIIRTVYGGTKQIFQTLLQKSSRPFREAVLVQFPGPGMWAIGFITGVTSGVVQTLGAEEVVNVFVPKVPNPTTGFLLFIPRSQLRSLDMSVEDAIKMVVSGGIITPAPRVVSAPQPERISAVAASRSNR